MSDADPPRNSMRHSDRARSRRLWRRIRAWGAVCERIGKRRRTVVIDRPGFGEDWRLTLIFDRGRGSRPARRGGQMGIPSFHLVGHSYGGLIALEMAIIRPEIVRSLHLIEPPFLDLLSEQSLVQEMDRRVRWIVEHHAEIGDEAATEAFFAMIGGERRSSACGARPIGTDC